MRTPFFIWTMCILPWALWPQGNHSDSVNTRICYFVDKADGHQRNYLESRSTSCYDSLLYYRAQYLDLKDSITDFAILGKLFETESYMQLRIFKDNERFLDQTKAAIQAYEKAELIDDVLRVKIVGIQGRLSLQEAFPMDAYNVLKELYEDYSDASTGFRYMVLTKIAHVAKSAHEPFMLEVDGILQRLGELQTELREKKPGGIQYIEATLLLASLHGDPSISNTYLQELGEKELSFNHEVWKRSILANNMWRQGSKADALNTLIALKEGIERTNFKHSGGFTDITAEFGHREIVTDLITKYCALGAYDKAWAYLKNPDGNDLELERYMADLYPDVLNMLYMHRGKYKEAYENLLKGAKRKERSYVQSLDVLEASFKNKLDAGKVALELDYYSTQVAEQERIMIKRSFFTGILGILLVLLILTLLMIFRARAKVGGMYAEIELLNKKLNAQYGVLTRSNSKLQKANGNISNLIALNEQKVRHRADSLQGYDHVLNQVIEELEGHLKLGGGVPVSEIFGIEKKIRSIMDEKQAWDDFEDYFNRIRPHFVSRIKKRATGLTKTDFKHILYILAKMSAKEVAVLTNVSVRSVETSRYRLKKRLGLNKSSELLPFLKTL